MHTHRIGLNRREALQVGYSALLAAGPLATPALAATPRKPKAVIVVFLTGAASQLDTFDPKPDAPAEIRGSFKAVSTAVPGVQVSELLPKLAARMDRCALVRTLSHKDNNHTAATHHVLTGAKQPGAFFDKPLSRDDWPVYAAGKSFLAPAAGPIPTGVTLPTFLQSGPLVWPGQHGGFLGPKHDPWQITQDPNKRDFRVDNLRLAPGLDVDHLTDRMALLGQVNRGQEHLAESADGKKLTDQQRRAVSLLTSGGVARAFEIDREPAAVRDRYGRHMFGQSLLLARRLVQAGVPVIQANMGGVQNWDSHNDIAGRCQKLVPPLDAGVAALFDDLHDTGLIDDTLVMVLGEFGRTPKISPQTPGAAPGRDHWAACFSALFAGAGVRGGQVIGKSDGIAAYPTTPPYSPDDVGATVYHVLGIDPASEVHDRFGRPVQLNRGAVISPLFSGRAG